MHIALLMTALCIPFAGCDGANTMTSNYSQTAYELPFNPDVPPLRPTSYDDDFNATRPAAEVPGYVELADKWKLFDPGDIRPFAAIDPRIGCAFMNNDGSSKTWAGFYQTLQLPTLGQTLQYGIYLKAQIAFVEQQPDVHGPLLFGLLLGLDMEAAPDASAVLHCGPSITCVDNSVDAPSVLETTGVVQSSVFATFDGLNAFNALLHNPAANYFRARLSQSQPSLDSFDVSLAFDAGFTGVDWTPLYEAEFTSVPASSLIKQAGFGCNSFDGSNGFAAYFNYFRVKVQSVGDLTATSGGFQQLGAV